MATIEERLQATVNLYTQKEKTLATSVKVFFHPAKTKHKDYTTLSHRYHYKLA